MHSVQLKISILLTKFNKFISKQYTIFIHFFIFFRFLDLFKKELSFFCHIFYIRNIKNYYVNNNINLLENRLN